MKRSLGLFVACLFGWILLGGNVQQVVNSIVATTCTNQFVRSLAATGAGTCASVAIGSDVSGLGTNVATLLATNTTGSTNLVGATSPTLVTPALGAATATSINFGGSTLSNYISATSWTPTDNSGASLAFTGVNANYTRIGNMVFAYATLTYPSTANGSNASIGSFPIAIPNQTYATQCSVTLSGSATGQRLQPSPGFSSAAILSNVGASITNAAMSLATLTFMCIYPAT